MNLTSLKVVSLFQLQASRAYKTLPTAFKKDQERKSRRSTSDNHRSSSRGHASPNSEGLFGGLELKLGIGKLNLRANFSH